MSRNGVIRFLAALFVFCWSLSVFFDKGLPSGVTWKIVASAVGMAIALMFFVLALIYRKKA